MSEHLPGAISPATGALAHDTYQLTKRFGAFTALDNVSLKVVPCIGLRTFDAAPAARSGWLRASVLRERARALITEFGVKTRGELAPIRSLSGGNVQRAVLARELSDDADVVIVANPVFGLNFAAGAEIHQRLMDVRNRGGAVLLISEDLDELRALSDRIAVMSEGRIVHEVAVLAADRNTLGAFMGGSAH